MSKLFLTFPVCPLNFYIIFLTVDNVLLYIFVKNGPHGGTLYPLAIVVAQIAPKFNGFKQQPLTVFQKSTDWLGGPAPLS